MNLKVESRTISIKGFARTLPGTVSLKIKVSAENVGESVSYLHKDDKSLQLIEKTPESIIITLRCTYYVPDYVKEIINIAANGLGKSICITDTIIHKCTVPEIVLTKEQLLQLIDTIIEAIEKKQPEIT